MAQIEPRFKSAHGSELLERTLKQFGWTMGDEFYRRYYSDPWVFNLANVVEWLAARIEELEPGKIMTKQKGTK